jgi:hypothetical protein
MAVRGDLVGEAYVRITADTTAMRHAIDRDGKRAGKAYVNAFTKQVDSIADDRIRSIQRRLAAAMTDPREFDAMAKNFDNPREAADHFRAILVKLNTQGQMNKRFLRQYTAAVNSWEKATIKANVASIEAVQLAEQEAAARTVQNKQLTNFFRLQTEGYKRVQVAQRAQAREQRTVQNKQLTNFFRLQTEGYKRLQVAQRAQAREQARMRAQIDETTEVIERHDVHWVNSARLARVAIDRTSARVDRLAYFTGRAFGKGSRNNFVNWVGSVVGGLASVAGKVITFPVKALTHVVDSFGTGFSAARAAGLGKFASGLRGLASVFGGKGGIVGLVAGAVAAMFAFGKVLPGIVSFMSMLGGVVSSVAGSISIGLVGGLLAITPAAAAAVTGLGSLISVFSQFFSDEKNENFVKNFFKPWKDMNTSYYPEVRKFLTNVRSGFDDLISDITPSLDRFFTGFQDKMNDRTTTRALRLWSDSIGRIATALSDSSTSFLSGLTGFFVPVLPYAERLGDIIRGWAVDFDSWANDRDGQNAVTAFMERAWVAGTKVAKILGNAAGIIGDVFMGGENTGTTFLDGILQKLQKLNTYLDTPKGQQAMKDWFGDVKTLGMDLGAIAGSVGGIIKSLNSPEGRQTAIDIADALTSMGKAAESVSKTAGFVGNIIDSLNTPLTTSWAKALYGDDDKKPAAFKPQQVKQKSVDTSKAFQDGGTRKMLTEYLVKVNVDDRLYQEKRAAIEAYLFNGKQITIKGNEALWNATKGTVAAYVFAQKQVPIKGNEADWNATKGTIAGFVFKTKVVPIDVAAESVYSWVNWWNSQSFSKTASIRYVTSGTLPNGGRRLGGGSTTASGGVFGGAQQRMIGEAGPEAVVPLDRPLWRVDPAVRALSAIAQGKSSGAMASGGIVGGRSVVVSPGAIVIQSPHSDPALVAESVLDRLVALA